MFQRHDWLYVLILGFFGLGNGLIFQNGTAAMYGMIAAIIYGIFDKWLYKRTIKKKRIKLFFIIPVATIVLCWGFLEVISPPKPPFTKEDAVIHATSGEGSVIDDFPKTIGQLERTIGKYQVIRETSVEEMKKEVYLVTFTEHWEKDMDSGTWKMAYEVDRQSMTLSSMEGEPPVYDEIHRKH